MGGTGTANFCHNVPLPGRQGVFALRTKRALDDTVESTPQKILVVDADEVLLRYLPMRFDDCAVLTATDPGTALSLLETHPDVRVLLADPNTSGFPLLEFCRTNFPGMRQVVITRGMGGQGPDQPRLDHAFRTLNKPCRETELVLAVRQALSPSGEGDARVAAVSSAALEARVAEQTQVLRQRATELEDLNRIKDELVMIAAHDIRAPLSVILGYTDILVESEPALSANGKAILERIHASANRLLAMVNNLLNLAAVEDGKMELSLAPWRMSEVVAGVVDSLRGLLDEQQIQCHFSIDGPDAEYLVDRARLEQVLQNLIANGARFNRRGGAVNVSVTPGPKLLRFTVSDTGKGFTPEQVGRAFTKFSRFSSVPNQGSGLGLAIAKAFVELHGGQIALESTPGQGSTFTFTVVPGFKARRTQSVLPS